VVSVGQKLIQKSVGMTGGYLDNIGTPSQPLLGEIEFADDAIGSMVAELKKRGLYQSTLVIISGKHGQSPIDSANDSQCRGLRGFRVSGAESNQPRTIL